MTIMFSSQLRHSNSQIGKCRTVYNAIIENEYTGNVESRISWVLLFGNDLIRM